MDEVYRKILMFCFLIFGVIIPSFFLGNILSDSSVKFLREKFVPEYVEDSHLQEYDSISRVSCGSDSMGLSLDCNDKLYLRNLEKDEKLIEGKIYRYVDNGRNIVHRLVYCLDENCSEAIFKGDNNHVGEKVYRENITKEVVKVEYN